MEKEYEDKISQLNDAKGKEATDLISDISKNFGEYYQHEEFYQLKAPHLKRIIEQADFPDSPILDVFDTIIKKCSKEKIKENPEIIAYKFLSFNPDDVGKAIKLFRFFPFIKAIYNEREKMISEYDDLKEEFDRKKNVYDGILVTMRGESSSSESSGKIKELNEKIQSLQKENQDLKKKLDAIRKETESKQDSLMKSLFPDYSKLMGASTASIEESTSGVSPGKNIKQCIEDGDLSGVESCLSNPRWKDQDDPPGILIKTAIEQSQEDIALKLVEKGADIITSTDGKSPLILSKEMGMKRLNAKIRERLGE